jgi:ribokinase
MENKIDLLTIGDLVAEPFIKIKEAEVEPERDSDEFNLCLDYGGKIPFESAIECFAVGNSPNVSVAGSRLGLKTSLVSYVGGDDIGLKNIEKLNKENVSTSYVKITEGLESNYHYVLWYKKERTILVKHTDFPYKLPEIKKTPRWIYLSSLSSNSLAYHEEILNYLNAHPEISFAIQPGTFQIRLGREKLKKIYERANVYFSNKEEAQKVLNSKNEDINYLLKEIYKLGPKLVVITDNINGSYSFDGSEILYMKSFYKESETLESTGAGDAYSGAFISALIYGKTIKEALTWGTINAKSVVKYVGPHIGLLTKEQIEKELESVDKGSYPVRI